MTSGKDDSLAGAIKVEGGEHFLVIGPAWVGDMVMAQSLFISLKLRDPDCRITVMAPQWTRPLLQRMPEVENSIDARLGHGELQLRKRRAMGRELAGQGFTTAIVLPNSFKSGLIPFHASIPRRIGWMGEWRWPLLTDCRRLRKEQYPLMVQRFAALAYPKGELPPQYPPPPRLQVDPAQVAATVEEFGLDCQHRILALCPGAEYGESKQWPAWHYAQLANRMIADGWRVWIFGSANDQVIAESILADIDGGKLTSVVHLAGKTSLAQAIDLMSRVSAVVSNDSGLMHVAAALQKPVVGIYGSTSPDFTPPLTSKVKLLATDIECRPCFKRECPFGHLKCLTQLSSARAISALQELVTDEQAQDAN